MGRTAPQSSGRRADRRSRFAIPPAALRQGGLVLLLAGAVGLISDVLPGSIGYGDLPSAFLDTLTGLLGAAVVACKDRRAVRQAAPVVLPLASLALLAGNDVVGVQPAAVFGMWLAAVFVWVGLWLPRGSATALSPAAACAYVLPLLAGAPRAPHDLTSAILIVPVAVALGEVIGANSAALRRAHSAHLRMLSELSREADTDPLTHVGNRRLADMVVQSLAPGDAVIIIDLDGFKEVNDRLGHLEGDEVLRDVGAFLQSRLRDGDAAARVGGDEFLVVFRGAKHHAVPVAERLLVEWHATAPLVTFSVGCAVHSPGRGPTETYAAADRALYQAKQAGRDRFASES